jgi:hypothetical protein
MMHVIMESDSMETIEATEAMAMREGLALATRIGCNGACDHGI